MVLDQSNGVIEKVSVVIVCAVVYHSDQFDT